MKKNARNVIFASIYLAESPENKKSKQPPPQKKPTHIWGIFNNDARLHYMRKHVILYLGFQISVYHSNIMHVAYS